MSLPEAGNAFARNHAIAAFFGIRCVDHRLHTAATAQMAQFRVADTADRVLTLHTSVTQCVCVTHRRCVENRPTLGDAGTAGDQQQVFVEGAVTRTLPNGPSSESPVPSRADLFINAASATSGSGR